MFESLIFILLLVGLIYNVIRLLWDCRGLYGCFFNSFLWSILVGSCLMFVVAVSDLIGGIL
mgnify:FL=1